MKKCEKCNEHYSDEMMFCPICGGNLVDSGNICQSCGKEVPIQFKFCPYCGNNMEVDEIKSTPAIENESPEYHKDEEEPQAETVANEEKFQSEVVADEEDDNMISFKIGNDVFKYPQAIDDIKLLRLSCLNISETLQDACESYLNNCNGIISMLNDNVEKKLENTLESELKKLVDQFVKLGYYDLDFDEVWSEYTELSSFNKLQEYLSDVRQAAIEIEEWVQSEKDRREYRKDSRTRLVGGGFGLTGAAKGIAKAGAVNMTTGAAHSVFNFFGNLSTDSKASDRRSELFNHVKNNLPDLFSVAGLNFSVPIINNIDVPVYNSEKNNKINDKIEQGLINEKDAVALLIQSIHDNPFISRTYKLLMERVPKDYEYDVYNMASYFKTTNDNGNISYAGDDYTFLDEFEESHTFFDKFIDNEDEFEIIQSCQTDLETLCNKYGLEEFFDDDMELLDDEDIDDLVDKYIISGKLNELNNIKLNLTLLKKEICVLNGENIEGFKKLDKYVSCSWFVEKYRNECDNIIKFVDPGIAILEAMESGDVKRFIELDSIRATENNRGWDYFDEKENPKGYEIALCYFLLGAANKDALSEFHIGLLYNNRIENNTAKCKFWFKLADGHGNPNAHDTLIDNRELFEKYKDISFEEAISGNEFNGLFASYALPSYIKTREAELATKRLAYIKEGKVVQFFAMDSEPVDNYQKAKEYSQKSSFQYQDDVVMAYYLKGAINDDPKCQYMLASTYASTAKSWEDAEIVKYWMTRASKNGLSKATEYLLKNKTYFDDIKDIDNECYVLKSIPSKYIFTAYIIKKRLNAGLKPEFIDKSNDAIMSQVRSLVLKASLETSLYIYGKIDQRKLSSAMSSYAYSANINKNDVIVYFDSTFFGGGEDGFILTPSLLISDRLPFAIYYDDLEYIRNDDGTLRIMQKNQKAEQQFTGYIANKEINTAMKIFHKLLGGTGCYNDENELVRINF